MQVFKNYKLLNCLFENDKLSIFKAQNIQTEESLLIKILKSPYPSRKEVENLEYEFKITSTIKISGIIKPIIIESLEHNKAIIMEGFDGITLHDYFKNKKSLLQMLGVAIKITRIIQDIHNIDIIHRNINPYNFLINPDTGDVRITGFNIAAEIQKESKKPIYPESFEGNLSYISPEQTGRMNRSIDFRSDYYSFGIMLYELFTEQLPYKSSDALELIHNHIAKQPPFPHQINLDLPITISQIIMRLIAKNAEDRYQSIIGLMSDLEECYKQLDSGGFISPFQIGMNDKMDAFVIPEKIYGRDSDIKSLFNEFEQTMQGYTNLVFICGSPGIGKTFLINEIQKPLIEKKGYFINGKFDQYKRNIPYHAFIQAFQELVRQILTESEQRILKWKNDLLSILGNNGNVIIDIIPELELIIGPQPPLNNLSYKEEQNRFNYVFTSFVKSISSPLHPIVLFMDDLQWADSASINMLKILLNDRNLRYFMMLGAYRDTEVDDSHQLAQLKSDLESENTGIKTIQLKPLKLFHVMQMLSDTLSLEINETESLATIVLDKTGGNPFFVKEYIHLLYEMGLLCNTNGRWSWEVDRINQTKITDNIVLIVSDNVKKLSNETQHVMKVASCIGNSFMLDQLSVIKQKTDEYLLDLLKNAINHGLLIKYENYYMFSHDRVREAVYSLLNDDERKKIHYTIGTVLLAGYSEEQMQDNIFALVSHLNIGKQFIVTNEDKIRLAELNLLAGKKAKASNAYYEAYKLFEHGIGFLPADSWNTCYNLTLSLFTEAGEASHLIGNYYESDSYFNTVLTKANNKFDKIRVYEFKILSYTAQHEQEKALLIGFDALRILDYKMPRTPSPLVIVKELLTARLIMMNINIDDIINRKDLVDVKQTAIARILMACTQPSYIGKPEYLPIIILKLLNLSLKNGNSSFGAYAYAIYGLLMCSALGKIDEGHKFGLVALDVIHKYNDLGLMSWIYFVYGNMLNHWKHHIKKEIEVLSTAYKTAKENGYNSLASYSLNHMILHKFFLNESLPGIVQQYNDYHQSIKDLHQIATIQAYELWYQFVLILTGEENQDVIKGGVADENLLKNEWINISEFTSLAIYTVAKQILLYHTGNFKQAIDIAIEGNKYLGSIMGMILVPEYYFFYALSLFARYPHAPRKEQKKYIRTIKKIQKKINKWAFHAPMNYEHKSLLLKAEMKALSCTVDETVLLYDRAIDVAKQNGFVQDEAIANECATRFLVSRALGKSAIPYIKEAYYLYELWGAKLKVRDIKNKYNELIIDKTMEGPYFKSKVEEGVSLDINTVMKASHAISGEIEIARLNEKLIKIILENAGAQRGLMILEREGELFVQAESMAENGRVTMFESIPIAANDGVPQSIINYVKRTKEAVVLDDASKEGRFKDDPYIRNIQVHSVLCVPLIKQQELKGIIYLENNLVIGAFPPERQETVRLLSTQAAISIENALLFDRTIQNEQKLAQNYEEMQSQYEEMESMNEEIVTTYHELELANKKLSRESALLEIFKQFAETSSQGFGMCDLEGNITYVNAALCNMLGGKTVDDLQGHAVWNYVPQELSKEKKELILHSLKINGQWTDELQIRNPATNARIPAIQNVFILRDNNNKPVCYGAIVTDLTDLKKAEETVRESEERYRLLVETMKEGLCMLDSGERITYINTSLASLLGYELGEIIGRPVSDFLDHDNSVIMEGQMAMMRQGDNKAYELEWLGKDSRKISTIVSPQAIHSAEGEYIASIGVITDITEKKKVEEEHEIMQRQLLQSQKMEAIGNLAGGVAHDFNNLLTAILGYGNLLMDQIDSRDERHDLVKEIINAAERSAVLTRQLLTFSRKQIMEATIFNLNKIVADMEKMLRRLIGEDIQFAIDLDHSIRDICADRGHIEQVLMNLVVNARDAMPSGGRLVIKTKNILVADGDVIEKYLPAGEYVCLSVEDNGIGMDEELMQNIFEPFFTTKDVSKGTGLGLSVVYGIVKQHGGWINVSSRPDEGASFRIYLPAAADDHSEAADERIQKNYAHGRGERILLVEDQIEVRKFTATALRQYGYVVHEAESIKEARDIFDREQGRFDIIFSDVVLPDGTGLDVVDAFQKMNRELKIVMSSGYMEQRSQFSEIKEKGYAFLQKPYSLDTLLHVVARISGQK